MQAVELGSVSQQHPWVDVCRWEIIRMKMAGNIRSSYILSFYLRVMVKESYHSISSAVRPEICGESLRGGRNNMTKHAIIAKANLHGLKCGRDEGLQVLTLQLALYTMERSYKVRTL